MKTELEKCMAGEWYDCHDPIFIERKAQASQWCARYNSTPYSQRSTRYAMLKEQFGAVGNNVSVGDEFICGFGNNIYIGNNVSINLRCMLIDCNKITIGNNVLIAPGAQINTSTHPVELADRLTPDWNPESGEYRWRTYALPITSVVSGSVILIMIKKNDYSCIFGRMFVYLHKTGNVCIPSSKISFRQ